MALKNLLDKVPFMGNLIHSHYVVERKMSDKQTLKTDTPCRSVLVRGYGNVYALLFTEFELEEAHQRYLSYEDQVGTYDRDQEAGLMVMREFVAAGAVKKTASMYLVYMYDGSVDNRKGYIFKCTDLGNAVLTRSYKYEDAIKYPSFWQRMKILFVGIFSDFEVEF